MFDGPCTNWVSKRNLTSRKVLITVWRSSAVVIHHSFLLCSTPVTADVFTVKN